ncbi:MAG: hypothetical protein AAFU03_18370, partial [Bacteroidota bacterium]
MRYFIPFLLLFLLGCSDGLQKVEAVDDLGYKEVFFVEKETEARQGTYQRFRPDGALSEIAHYKDNVLDGKRVIFNDFGDTSVVETYFGGGFEGAYRTFYDSVQQVRLTGRYDNNEMTGEWKMYYPNGQQAEVVTFAHNNENGPFTEWYENGALKAEGAYLDGDREHGQLRLYDKTGDLERVMECDRGRCSTIWRRGESD